MDASTTVPGKPVHLDIVYRGDQKQLVGYTVGDTPALDTDSANMMLQQVASALGSTVKSKKLCMQYARNGQLCILFVIQLVSVTAKRTKRLLEIADRRVSHFLAVYFSAEGAPSKA